MSRKIKMSRHFYLKYIFIYALFERRVGMKKHIRFFCREGSATLETSEISLSTRCCVTSGLGRSVAFHASGFDYFTLVTVLVRLCPGQTRTAKGVSARMCRRGGLKRIANRATRRPGFRDSALRSFTNNPIIYTFSLNGAS